MFGVCTANAFPGKNPTASPSFHLAPNSWPKFSWSAPLLSAHSTVQKLLSHSSLGKPKLCLGCCHPSLGIAPKHKALGLPSLASACVYEMCSSVRARLEQGGEMVDKGLSYLAQ